MSHQTGQFRPATIARGINRDIVQTFHETGQPGGIFRLGPAELGNRAGNHRPVSGVIQIGTGRANHPRPGRHLPRQKPAEQAGQDFTPGQIAGAAKDHQIKGFDRNDAADHGTLGVAVSAISALPAS